MKKECNLHSRITEEDETAITKIREIAKESKTDLICRLLKNELNLLTNKPELIVNGQARINEVRFQCLFEKIDELQKTIEENFKDVQKTQKVAEKRLTEINAVARKIFGCLLLCNKDVLRSFFVISRVLYENFKITKEKVNVFVNNAIVNTGHAMRDTIETLDWELKRIADSFEEMGKDIKAEDLK